MGKEEREWEGVEERVNVGRQMGKSFITSY